VCDELEVVKAGSCGRAGAAHALVGELVVEVGQEDVALQILFVLEGVVPVPVAVELIIQKLY
jgi:hypothetical protein